MHNPYVALHKEFRAAGARVLLSSGQACVLYGIAAFSKDGDWIIEESQESCRAVRAVLESQGAVYRLGAPLDPQWLSHGWTSHFELTLADGYRARTDFVSRPPRIHDLSGLWNAALKRDGVDIVDIESLIHLKQTRRQRDYAIIGALSEACGFRAGEAHVALNYLQDFELLRASVTKWPSEAACCTRDAVQLLVRGAPRRDVVIALAVEQDAHIEADSHRIQALLDTSRAYAQQFGRLKAGWTSRKARLGEQHIELTELARTSLGQTPCHD